MNFRSLANKNNSKLFNKNSMTEQVTLIPAPLEKTMHAKEQDKMQNLVKNKKSI